MELVLKYILVYNTALRTKGNCSLAYQTNIVLDAASVGFEHWLCYCWYMTLGGLVNLRETQFSHLQNGVITHASQN